MMQRILLMLLIPSILLAACAGSPVLDAEINQFSFGEVVNGEIVSKDIVIKNTGASDLLIGDISTSCGCTKGELDRSTITPGETATLHITFDSGAHGPEFNGELVRQVFIPSNDPAAPETVIEFSATVLLPESN